MDPTDFRAPFISREQVQAEAERFRHRYWPSGVVPVDIHAIIEFELDMRIHPIAGLRECADIDALLLGDLSTIVVDSGMYMDDRMQNRVRFSLAHEIGHKVLHPDLYGKIAHRSVEEWIASFQNIPEDQYAWIEQHAYEFTGRLLVPVERLNVELKNAVDHARKAGFVSWDESGDAARQYIATALSRVFGVSSQVIEKRIVREKLWPPV